MQNNINAALIAAFSPLLCDVEDESHFHSRGSQTHYKVVLVSDVFSGMSRVKRHQKIYMILGNIMQQIHALAIHAYTVEEWQQSGMMNKHVSPLCAGGSKHDMGN